MEKRPIIQIAQGDLLFTEVELTKSDLDRTCTQLSTKVVAFGEKTGHSHQIFGRGILYAASLLRPSPSFFVAEEDGVEIRQEGTKPDEPKHENAVFPKGVYSVIQQRQVDYAKQAEERAAD